MPDRPVLASAILVLAGWALLVPAGAARAHHLIVDCRVLTGQKVQVTGLFSDPFGSAPARGADVKVFRRDGKMLTQGKTDRNGDMIFSYDEIEPLRVQVSQVDHEAEVLIPADALKTSSTSQAAPSSEGTAKESAKDSRQAERANTVISSSDRSAHEGIKDVLLGVGFLLALGAFGLSLRNARRLKELQARSHRSQGIKGGTP